MLGGWIWAAVLSVALAFAYGISAVGLAAVTKAEAQSAADAAALAGAGAGESAARSIASDNGGTLLEYRVDGATTVVVVQVGQAQAVAAAARIETVVHQP